MIFRSILYILATENKYGCLFALKFVRKFISFYMARVRLKEISIILLISEEKETVLKSCRRIRCLIFQGTMTFSRLRNFMLSFNNYFGKIYARDWRKLESINKWFTNMPSNSSRLFRRYTNYNIFMEILRPTILSLTMDKIDALL